MKEYHISSTLSNRVGYFIPAWNEVSSKELMNEKFLDALKLVGDEFYSYVERLVRYGG